MINANLPIERHCTVLMHYDKSTPPNEDEIREELESKDVEKKISGLKTLVSLLLNGEVMPKLLMTVIRFCVPCDDHKVKKLLLIYWEVRATLAAVLLLLLPQRLPATVQLPPSLSPPLLPLPNRRRESTTGRSGHSAVAMTPRLPPYDPEVVPAAAPLAPVPISTSLSLMKGAYSPTRSRPWPMPVAVRALRLWKRWAPMASSCPR